MGLCGSTANQDEPAKAVPKDDKPQSHGDATHKTSAESSNAAEGSGSGSVRGSASATGSDEGKHINDHNHTDETEPQTPSSPIDSSEITLSPTVVTLGEHLHAQKVKVVDGPVVVEELRAIELQSPKPKTPNRRTSVPKQKMDAPPPAVLPSSAAAQTAPPP